jgi:NAD+ kinase
VLPPESREMLLTPLAPHLVPNNALVLPEQAVVEVQLAGGQQATFSVDGERDLDLMSGETVRVTISPHRARFVRLGPPAQFYERLARRLNWVRSTEGSATSDALRSMLDEGDAE